MITKMVIINNETGLHARPASILVQSSSKFKSKIHIEANGKIINAKSIISVLSGGLGQGNTVKLVIDGEDEETAVQVLTDLFNSNFGE